MEPVVFTGFDGGEYGRMDKAVAARADKQMFTGVNVVRYRNGLVGPRPGLKEITLSGTPTTGTLQGLDNAVKTSGGTGPWFWVAISDDVYLVDVGAGTMSAAYGGAGSITATVPIPKGGYAGSTSYINVSGDGVKTLDHQNATVTDAASTPAGTCIGWYGKNSFRAVASQGARLHWSGIYPAWGTWGASDYIDIGTALPITMLREHRDGLLIGKASGEMFLLTGALATDSTSREVRRLSRAGGPRSESWGAALEGNVVWYIGWQRDYPSMFNGSMHTELDWLNFTGGVAEDDDGTTPGFAFLPVPWMGPEAFVCLSGQTGSGAVNRMLEYSGGVFTYHTFDVDAGPWGCCLSDPTAAEVGQATKSLVIAERDGDAYYHYTPGLDRPGFSGDTLAQPGDGGDTGFDCEVAVDYWDPNGLEFQVDTVRLNLRAWNTGSANNVTAKVKVEMYAGYGVDSAADETAAATTAQTVLDVAPSAFSTSGTDVSVDANIGTGSGGGRFMGRGCRVTVTDLYGCAVRDIIVYPVDKTRSNPVMV